MEKENSSSSGRTECPGFITGVSSSTIIFKTFPVCTSFLQDNFWHRLPHVAMVSLALLFGCGFFKVVFHKYSQPVRQKRDKRSVDWNTWHNIDSGNIYYSFIQLSAE